MSPTHFELYVIELFNTLGYSLDWVGGSGDEGIDGVGTDAQGKSVILQTKRYADANKIQPTHIREFIGTLEYHNVDLGLYVTTGFATAGIHTYIREHRGRNIQFIDKDKLVELMIKAYSK